MAMKSPKTTAAWPLLSKIFPDPSAINSHFSDSVRVLSSDMYYVRRARRSKGDEDGLLTEIEAMKIRKVGSRKSSKHEHVVFEYHC